MCRAHLTTHRLHADVPGAAPATFKRALHIPRYGTRQHLDWSTPLIFCHPVSSSVRGIHSLRAPGTGSRGVPAAAASSALPPRCGRACAARRGCARELRAVVDVHHAAVPAAAIKLSESRVMCLHLSVLPPSEGLPSFRVWKALVPHWSRATKYLGVMNLFCATSML